MKDLDQIDGAIEWLGVQYKTILSPEKTGGAMSVVDSWSPEGSAPPRHAQQTDDGTFVTLTRACKFWLKGQEITADEGESMLVPRGTEHTFIVRDNGPCRHLVIMTPGGFDSFFADMAAGQYPIPEDMPAIEESAKRHNLAFTGPPLD